MVAVVRVSRIGGLRISGKISNPIYFEIMLDKSLLGSCRTPVRVYLQGIVEDLGSVGIRYDVFLDLCSLGELQL